MRLARRGGGVGGGGGGGLPIIDYTGASPERDTFLRYEVYKSAGISRLEV